MDQDELLESLEEIRAGWGTMRDDIGHRLGALENAFDQFDARAQRMGLGGTGVDVARDLATFRAMAGPNAEIDPEVLTNYRAAFETYLRRGDRAPGVQASMSVGNDPAGGYLVEPDLYNRIVRRIWELSPIRQIANIQNIGSDAIEGPRETSEMDAGWIGETQARPDTAAPGLGKFRIPAHECFALPQISQMLLEDSRFSISTWLAEKLAARFARLEGAAFVSGNGVGKPRGFLDCPTSSAGDDTRADGTLQYVTSGASGAFPKLSGSTADDADCLFNVMAELKNEYHANARWVMTRRTSSAIRKLKDGIGRTLWQDSLVANTPPLLLGYPVTFAPDMPELGGDSLSIAFGDFGSGYMIADRLALVTQVDPYTARPWVRFYSRKRVGGDVVNFDAIKLVKFAA